MRTKKRLDILFRESECICFDQSSKIVFMSDCHRGSGTHGDNYLNNSPLTYAALSYYYQGKFSYIELGDGDELWENSKPDTIILAHSNVFELLSRFYRAGRYLMLYGNHDKRKENNQFFRRYYEKQYYESIDCKCDMFPEMTPKEAVILKDYETGNKILLVHGHQGDFLNDDIWRFTRFLVRHFWKRLELIGVLDPTSAAKNYQKKKKTERKLSDWADNNNVILIAGHTHRPVLPKPGESLYFNDGSCVHPSGITALEIENGYITLVKWSTTTNRYRDLYVGREILGGPYKIRDYFAHKT